MPSLQKSVKINIVNLMKNYIFSLSICFSFLVQINSQIITVNPALPTDLDSVVVTFDATQGNAALKGYTGDVYAHTGVKVEGSDSWAYVIGTWGNNSTQPKLSRTGVNTYKLAIKPDIRTFYNVPAVQNITQLCFVFRSSDGTKQTSPDIFYNVYSSGLNVSFINPSMKFSLFNNNQKIPILVSASANDSICLFLDNVKIRSIAGDSLIDTIIATGINVHTLISLAYKGTGSVVGDTISYLVHGITNIASLPAGIRDGINYVNDSTVTFVLFAPYKNYVYLIGDFNNWMPGNSNLMNEDTGAFPNTTQYSAIIDNIGTKGSATTYKDSARFWITVTGLAPGKEYIFQYLIDGNIRIADPYVEKISDPGNDNAIPSGIYPNLITYPTGKTTGIAGVIQTAQVPYNWMVKSFTPPDKNKLVIYELLIRDFTANKDIKTVTDSINYLKTLGINAIELMPFSEFDGNDSWGYNPCFYFAPDKAYGTRDDYKNFIDVCHQNGIAVIQDMVLDFSTGNSPLVQMYFANGNPSIQNPWYNVVPPVGSYTAVDNFGYDFNHDSPYTRKLVDSITSFWMTNYKIDGFRFDMAKGWTNTAGSGDNSYDAPRITNLELTANHMWKVNPKAYAILELFTGNSEENLLSNYGLMIWGNMNNNYCQAAMSFNDAGGSWDLSGIYYKSLGWNNPGLIGYMESHDEERVAYKCETWGDSLGAYKIKSIPIMCQRVEMNNLFFLTIPGPKMIWQFGELGYDSSINSNGGRTNDKVVLWNYYSDIRRKNIYNMVRTLNTLKQTEPVFNSVSNFSASLTGAVKTITLDSADDRVVIIGNFDVKNQSRTISFPVNGKWYEFFSNDSIIISGDTLSINLNPGEYRMYSTRKLQNNYLVTPVIKISIRNKLQVAAFPNPFDKSLLVNIDNETGLLALYDVTGHLILQSTINGSKLLNTENIKAGIYFLDVRYSNGDIKVTKVMKL